MPDHPHKDTPEFWEHMHMVMDGYDIARQITDELLGEGSYAEMNAGHPDPRVQRAIARTKMERPLVEVLDAIIGDAMMERATANETMQAGEPNPGAPSVTDISQRIVARLTTDLKAFIEAHEKSYYYPPDWAAIAKRFGLEP